MRKKPIAVQEISNGISAAGDRGYKELNKESASSP